MSPNLQQVDPPLTRDVMGRYICNTFSEARRTWEDGPGFDAVIIGGGTFGAALAQNLYFRSERFRDDDVFAPDNYRILVLEAGPYILPEHVQNVPQFDLKIPRPESIAELRLRHVMGPQEEVWGISWHSPEPFTGLAYCLGGRSLYWGGWSPRFLDTEMPTTGASANLWPPAVVEQFKTRFFHEANRQLGANEANDFIDGDLHRAMRARLLQALNDNAVRDALRFDDLPLQVTHPELDENDVQRLQERLIEAPYAINTRARSGFFPSNKFSSVPLLVAAARNAAGKSGGDDNRKRLMIVPNCRATRLDTELVPTATGALILRVRGVETNLGYVPIPSDGDKQGVAVLAGGAIESTRLALRSLDALPATQRHLIGKNLMAHTRRNMHLLVPRDRFPELNKQDRLEVSALQVRCAHEYDDGTIGHFHLQVTASGTPVDDANAERELFQKIPDLEHYERFTKVELDRFVAIAIRAIGEMEPQNPGSFIDLDAELDEFGQPRAFVALNQQTPNHAAANNLTPRDRELYEAMSQAMEEVARIFDQDLTSVRRVDDDALGTTHHEAGTLWIGDDPQQSVTNQYGRFHGVTNAFVADLSMLPTCGSANPMLPGIAWIRRLAKHLVPEGDGRLIGDLEPVRPYQLPDSERPVQWPELPTDDDGFRRLFDGRTGTWWSMAGKGQSFVIGDTLQLLPGNDLGLLWCSMPLDDAFVVELEWFLAARDGQSVFEENSGVFLRFPHPDSKGFHNPAWVPVVHGLEVQIDPDGVAPDGRVDVQEFRTGAIYELAGPEQAPHAPSGQWNKMTITVEGQNYQVRVNGKQTANYTHSEDGRAQPGTAEEPVYFGVQAYGGAKVAFRNIRYKPL